MPKMMTMNDCMLEALPEIQRCAEALGNTELVLLCQRLTHSTDLRIALWCFMLAWCGQFDGVAQQLQRSAHKLVMPDTPLTPDSSTLH